MRRGGRSGATWTCRSNAPRTSTRAARSAGARLQEPSRRPGSPPPYPIPPRCPLRMPQARPEALRWRSRCGARRRARGEDSEPPPSRPPGVPHASGCHRRDDRGAARPPPPRPPSRSQSAWPAASAASRLSTTEAASPFMKTDRNSFNVAASPACSETTSTGMPRGRNASANARGTVARGQRRRREPAVGHRPEQRNVRESNIDRQRTLPPAGASAPVRRCSGRRRSLRDSAPGLAAAATSSATLAVFTLSTASQPETADSRSSARTPVGTSSAASGSYPRTSTSADTRSSASRPPSLTESEQRHTSRAHRVRFHRSGCDPGHGVLAAETLSENETELLTIFATFRQYACCHEGQLQLRGPPGSDRAR